MMKNLAISIVVAGLMSAFVHGDNTSYSSSYSSGSSSSSGYVDAYPPPPTSQNDNDRVSLVRGWQLLGTSCSMTQEQMQQVFDRACISSVYAYDPALGYQGFFPNNVASSTLDSISPHAGFWVYATQDCTITFNSCNNQAVIGFSLNGTVVDSQTNQPLANVSVKIENNGQVIAEGTTDADGNFVLSLNSDVEPGNYVITASKEGYMPFIGSVQITSEDIQNGSKNYGQIQMVSGSSGVTHATLHGKVIDSVTGSPIAGASISIYRGSGVTDTSHLVTSGITTDENGEFEIPDLEAGTYTILVEKNGYVVNTYTIVVDENQENMTISISPALTADENMRIILSWGEQPSDLDSHLLYIKNQQVLYHIAYYHKVAHDDNGNILAQLDRDDTTSYGPETTTIYQLDREGLYKYFVHDYTHRGATTSYALANSGANVKVITSEGQQYTFNVPYGDGTVWKVFDIVEGHIIPCTQGCIFIGTTSNTDLMNRNILSTSVIKNVLATMPSK